MVYVLIYVVGFLLTLTFLKLFGKKMGIDYDPPHYDGYDDYANNTEAYLLFSAFWVGTAPLFLIGIIIRGLYKFTEWFIKYPNNP